MSKNDKVKVRASAGNIVCAVIVSLLLIAGVLFVIKVKGCDLYIGGTVVTNINSKFGVLITPVCLLPFCILNLSTMKKEQNSDTRRIIRKNTVILSVFLILMLAFAGYIIGHDIVRSNKATIAEYDVGNGKSIIFMENEEHFSTSGAQFYEIIIYSRDGIILKKTGVQDEYNFTNDQMIKNGQYRVETGTDTVKVYYDYGSLTGGLKWADDYTETPPEYIEREYKI